MKASKVLQYLPPDSIGSVSFYMHKLCCETDPSDVYSDLENGVEEILVIDARSAESYEKGHIPGAISLPHKEMNLTTTDAMPRNKVMVVYCDGIGCNASTKGALKLASLGFRVKELIGGLDWWIRDGYPVEQGDTSLTNFEKIKCGC